MNHPIKIIEWDFKDEVPILKLNHALCDVPRPQFFSVRTGTDQQAIVVAVEGTSQREAQEFYDDHR